MESVVVGAERINGVLRDRSSFKTVRIEDPALLLALEEHNVNAEGRVPSALLGWLLPMALISGLSFWMMRRLRNKAGGIGSGILSFSKSKARMTEGEQTGVTFDDIGSAGEAVTDLREITEFLKNPEHFQRLGGKIPKGVLLVGPPATGKLLARADRRRSRRSALFAERR